METTSASQTEYLTDNPEKAAWFDGRDNEEMKLKFFETILGEPLEITLKKDANKDHMGMAGIPIGCHKRDVAGT